MEYKVLVCIFVALVVFVFIVLNSSLTRGLFHFCILLMPILITDTMKKDTYYFSHDCNAQNDPKCILLIDSLGMEGYGIFWGLIEMLRQEPTCKLPMSILPGLAKRWGTSKEKVTAVVSGYNLFTFDDEMFFSDRLIRHVQEVESRRIAMSEAGKKGALLKKNEYSSHLEATLKLPLSHPEATLKQGKERKGKEIKENKKEESGRFTPPNHEDVFGYMRGMLPENMARSESEKFVNYYESKGWVVGKAKMKSWQAAARGWVSRSKNYSGGSAPIANYREEFNRNFDANAGTFKLAGKTVAKHKSNEYDALGNVVFYATVDENWNWLPDVYERACKNLKL